MWKQRLFTSNKLRTGTLLQRSSLGVRRVESWQAQSNPSAKRLLEGKEGPLGISGF